MDSLNPPSAACPGASFVVLPIASARGAQEDPPDSIWLDMQDPNTHRELVANVGNLKASVRGVILAVSCQPSCRLPAAVQRANQSLNGLRRLLSSVSDQTARLPLETSKRLVEVDLADLCQQLLQSCQPSAPWPAPNVEGGTVPALQHPSWLEIQQLIAQVFQVLTQLCSVAVRACTRSPDPLMVLMQLASPRAMDACVQYMQQLWELHSTASRATTAAGVGDAGSDDGGAVEVRGDVHPAPSHVFASTVAAFSSCYSLLASAVDSQPGLEELELQLVSSLCSTNFLPMAVQLLLGATCPEAGCSALEADCQQAGWQLLTLALFLSGGDIAISPVAPSGQPVRPGQHIPSSVLAEQMRLADKQQLTKVLAAVAPAAPADSLAAVQAATGLPLATMQQQLLGDPVLLFLQERLQHAVREMRLIGSSSSGNLGTQQPVITSGPAAAASGGLQVPLLPGRCAPDDQDVLTAALRTLRCWRALLVGPAGHTLPLSSSHGVQLLLAVLNGALAESIRASSSERQALRGRLIRVTVHGLQLLCSRVPQEVLLDQLFSLTAALSDVVSSAGAFWDANKRAVKSADLPYTGQVRCVDKTTGDMMVRYTMAAQSALEVLLQLVASCRGKLLDQQLMSVMLSAGLVPAMEKLYRQLPVVSPAHVTAADLLSQVLHMCHGCDLSAGQLPLLATLRKFLVKAAGVPEPDRDAAVATAVKLADMLGNLADSCEAGQSVILVKHAAAHLLPALQVFCGAVLRGPVPASCSLTSSCSIDITMLAAAPSGAGTAGSASCHLFPVLLSTYKRLAALANRQARLGLLEQLVGSQALSLAAGMIASRYWACPHIAAAALRPCNAALTAQHAVQLVVPLLEELMTSATSPTGSAGCNPLQLHVSNSADCLVVAKRDDFSNDGGMCQVGNLKCCGDGVCSCGSPKACSDVVTTTAAAMGSGDLDPSVTVGADFVQGKQQQLMLLISALLESKLLPETHQLLQQLPAAADLGNAQLESNGSMTVGNTPKAAGAGGATVALSAAMAVPARKASALSRDGKFVGSPTTSGSILRPQTSAPQQYLLGYTGSEPPAYGSSYGSQPRSGSRFAPPPPPTMLGTPMPLQRTSSLGQVAASNNTVGAVRAAAAQLSSTETGVADCGGLLRGGSWGSFNNAWLTGTSAPGDVNLTRENSAVLGSSSGSLNSLAAVNLWNAADGGTEAAATGAATGASALQLRLDAVLLAVGQAVLDLASAGLLDEVYSTRVSAASGGSSSSGGDGSTAGGGLSRRDSMLPGGGGRISYPGSSCSFQLQSSTGEVIANLSSSIAAARRAALAGLGVAGGSSDGGSPLSCAEGSSGDALFPVDLGLAGLASPDSQQPALAATAAADTVDVGPEAGSRLPPDVMRRVMGAVMATAPLLARQCMSAELELSSHVLMGRISPPLVGCWHPGCVNMAGPSEVAMPSKPCSNCKVAVFCSKGCEKAAWSIHTVACGRLAAAAAAAQLA